MTATKNDVSADRVRELFDYDPETGRLTWRTKPHPSSRPKAGLEAGHIEVGGYRVITFDGRTRKAHRLAWLHHFGEWPTEIIDHINGDRADNRIENLRQADVSGNKQNLKRAPISNKSSGLLGVTWHRGAGRWRAQIRIRGEHYSLGLFATPEAAHEAYLQAKAGLHPFSTIHSGTPCAGAR